VRTYWIEGERAECGGGMPQRDVGPLAIWTIEQRSGEKGGSGKVRTASGIWDEKIRWFILDTETVYWRSGRPGGYRMNVEGGEGDVTREGREAGGQDGQLMEI